MLEKHTGVAHSLKIFLIVDDSGVIYFLLPPHLDLLPASVNKLEVGVQCGRLNRMPR